MLFQECKFDLLNNIHFSSLLLVAPTKLSVRIRCNLFWVLQCYTKVGRCFFFLSRNNIQKTEGHLKKQVVFHQITSDTLPPILGYATG